MAVLAAKGRRSDAPQRVKTFYVSEEDRPVFDDLVACAKAMGQPVSTLVIDAIRLYPPLKAYVAGREAGESAA